MMPQEFTDASTQGTVTISQDDEIRLNNDVYRSYFVDCKHVRLGIHPDFDLIFIQPVVNNDDGSVKVRDTAYKIDHTSYTGEVSCRTFLQRHNYHHTRTTQYIAEWWADHGMLCVDLTAPVDPESL